MDLTPHQYIIIFCWNFDWDPKSNLDPVLEQCDLYTERPDVLLLIQDDLALSQ